MIDPHNDKHAMILLGASITVSGLATLALVILGNGVWSMIGLLPCVITAEVLGKVRNGV